MEATPAKGSYPLPPVAAHFRTNPVVPTTKRVVSSQPKAISTRKKNQSHP